MLLKDLPSSAFFTESATCLRLGLVGLGRGEHHYEEGEQQGDEIGVGDQPAFVIRV